MTTDPTAALAARARRAYERGRLGWALRRAALATAVAAVALAGCPAPARPAACALALGAALAACLWRGGEWGRGVRLGFLAGLAPCWGPALVRAAYLSCDRVCPALPPVCVAGGVVAGFLVAWLGLQRGGGRRFWLAAAGAAALAGAIGCLPAGLAGLAGMALGMLAGAAAPALAARAAA